MRRHVAMGLAFVMSVAVSASVVAQQPKPATGGTATTSAKDAGASTTSTAAAGKDAGASTSSTGSGAMDAGAATSASTSSSMGAGGGSSSMSGPSTAAAGASASTASSGMEGATYAVRLRDLEARVDELKDQVRRSHTRLALLSDTIMSGGAAGSRAEVTFKNEMSNAFKLTRAVIVLDGAMQYNRQDETGALADQKEIPVFNGSIPPGDHTVSIMLNFQGNGYGVFTYLKGYKFEVKSSHSFTAVEGRTMNLEAIALEKGGVTTALEQRPTIEWREKANALGAPPSAPAAAPAGGGTGSATSGGSVTTSPGGASGSGGFSIGGGSK